MADFTIKRIDDMEAVYAGAFKRARAELGISSFGVQVIDIPPHIDRYPEHSHADDGQEEVFWRCGARPSSRSRGSATISIPRR